MCAKFSSQNILILFTLAIIAFGSAALDFYLPPVHDDLSFYTYLGLENYRFPNRSTLSFIIGHFEGCNGRFFDFMGPVFINLLPRALAAAVMGSMVALFFYSLLLLVNIPCKKHTAFSISFLTFSFAVLPWWDSMFLRVCQFNYLWAATFSLLFFFFFFRDNNNLNNYSRLGLLLIAFFAGSSHEQFGISVAGALGAYACFKHNYRRFSRFQWQLSIALAAGVLFVLSSPNLWHRTSTLNNGYPLFDILFTTFPLFLILLATLGVLACKGSVSRFVSPSDFVMIGAALFSAIIAVVAGVPGRTGWLAESVALIILAKLILSTKIFIKPFWATFASSLSLIFLCSHFFFSIQYQARGYDDYFKMKRYFIANPDGIVFLDYMHRFDPPAITLCRTRGIYPMYDSWSPLVFTRAFGDSVTEPTILPYAFKKHFPLQSDSLTIDNVTIYRSGASNVRLTVDSIPLQSWNGILRVVRNAPGFQVAYPLELEPGDANIPTFP